MAKFFAEHVSRVAYNARPMALGDYGMSTHTQGEVIGTMDFIIHDDDQWRPLDGRRDAPDWLALDWTSHASV